VLIVLLAVTGGITLVIVFILLFLFIVNYYSVENRTIRKDNEAREAEWKEEAEQ
jgi:hypothetical protein